MANRKHLAKLKKGVEAWNRWREENPNVRPELGGAKLFRINLQEADPEEANPKKPDHKRSYLQGANLREANLQGADLQGANLRKANLQGANLEKANLSGVWLQGANLEKANLRDTLLGEARLRKANLQGANLDQASLGFAQLQEARLQGVSLNNAHLFGVNLWKADLPKVRLARRVLRSANLFGANLRGAVLWEADLREADLREADLTRANLFGANLKRTKLFGANLSESQALFTDFSNANLTGACIGDWGINQGTEFNDVQCDYIYLGWYFDYQQKYPTDRRPHNPDEIFKPGDFARLMEEARNTVDLIFSNGIDWQAFLTSFQNLQVSGEYGELSIQGISKKSDGSFVIDVDVPQAVDRAAIEQDFKTRYESELKRLEGLYQERLQAKEQEITIYREQSASMTEIVKMMANRPITNIAEVTSVSENKPKVTQQFYGSVTGVAGNVEGDMVVNPKSSLVESAAEIQELLQFLNQSYPSDISADIRAEIEVAVKGINKDPELKQRLQGAITAGSKEALKELMDNPYVNILIAAYEGWKEG
ncbi:MAG: pentapeptide repeat-containing protein [Cyanobacteria bacterium P01_G01_bin.54]